MPTSDRHLNKGSYFDPEFGTVAVKIMAGELFATAEPIAISTLLGSCVAVCLYDSDTGVGGMNHFMLPELLQGGKPIPCTGACSSNCCARYGSCAIRQLLQRLELLGANRGRLAAKLFGAGQIMATRTEIGGINAAFAVDYLKQQKIPIIASDLGDCCPRKLIFFPVTGQAWVKRMPDLPIMER